MGNQIRIEGELLHRLQQIELSILKDVADFCDENSIKYCISSGTLLGAVRHKGFIPWDDDVDISMPRADYERFVSLSKELPDCYEFVSTLTNPKYPLPISKVRKKGTVMMEPSMSHLDIEHGVWIDVFPLDRVKKVDKLKKRAYLMNLLTTAINQKLGAAKPNKKVTRIFCLFLGLFGVKTLDSWRTSVMTAEEKTDSTLLTNFASNLGPLNLLFDESVYFPLKKIQFEDYLFFAPNDANTWLTGAYGDYMTLPPPEKQVNRHAIMEIKL